MSSKESLQVTLGGLLVSVLIATFVYAVGCFQTFLYWRSRFNDRLGLRILVWAVLLFETAHSFCFWIYLYTIVVQYYGVREELENRHWSISISVVFHGLITGCVQAYYSYRVYVLSRGRKFIPMMCWVCSLIECCGSIGITVIHYRVGPVVFAAKYELLPTLIIILDVVVDVVNTTTLCYYLHQRRTGIKSTDQVVTTLIEWSVESGLITALAAVGMLIACVVTPNTALFLSMTTFYAKLYSNSLLSSLNGRGPLSPFRAPQNTANSHTNFGIKITQTTETSTSPIDLPSSDHRPKDIGIRSAKAWADTHEMQFTNIVERDSDTIEMASTCNDENPKDGSIIIV